jgi:hypothetical protein
MTALLHIQQLGLVSLRSDNTEESKGLCFFVDELVRSVGRDIENIQHSKRVADSPYSYSAFPTNTNHEMLMLVSFQRRVSTRLNLKIAQVERRVFCFCPNNHPPHYPGPISPCGFIPLVGNSFPVVTRTEFFQDPR